MTTTDLPATNVERLLEDAWTLDCAIRLREGAWAAVAAERLVARLARHEQDALHAWNAVDEATGEALAAEVRAVRAAVPAVAAVAADPDGAPWPRPDVHQRVATLIHHEAVAVAEAVWRFVD
jgi:hypothetical protein